jgi:hypothetical protein
LADGGALDEATGAAGTAVEDDDAGGALARGVAAGDSNVVVTMGKMLLICIILRLAPELALLRLFIGKLAGFFTSTFHAAGNLRVQRRLPSPGSSASSRLLCRSAL